MGQVETLVVLPLEKEVAGDHELDAGQRLAHRGDPGGVVAFGLFGDLERFAVDVAGLFPLRGGRGGVGQRHGLVERGHVEVRPARRLQHLAPQQQRFMLIRAADFRHLGQQAHCLRDAAGSLRAGGVVGQRERGLGQFQGDGLIAVGLPQAAVVLQPRRRLREELQRLLPGEDQEAEILDLGEERCQTAGSPLLAGIGRIGQHLVVDVQGQLQVAQLLRRLAVPEMGFQADVSQSGGTGAVPLENIVKGLGGRFQRLRAVVALGIGIRLREMVVDQRDLELHVLHVRLRLASRFQGFVSFHFPGRRFRRRRGRQLVEPRLELVFGLPELLPRLVQVRAGVGQVFFSLLVVLSLDGFRLAQEVQRLFIRKSPHAAAAIAAAG